MKPRFLEELPIEKELARQDDQLDAAIAALAASPRGRRLSPRQLAELEALRIAPSAARITQPTFYGGLRA